MKARSALTLVELMASLVIVTMLVVAALAATTAMARSELALRRIDEATEGPAPGLAALLETDLVHAHHWRPLEDGFAIQTNVRLSVGTLRLEHVPSVVTYEVRRIDGRPHLVRVQETAPEPPRTELVAVGAGRVTLAPDKDIRPNALGWKAIGGGCTVRVAFEREGGASREVAVRVVREGVD